MIPSRVGVSLEHAMRLHAVILQSDVNQPAYDVSDLLDQYTGVQQSPRIAGRVSSRRNRYK